MNKQIEIEIQAAAFRGLLKHLQKHSEVQNIDLMNLAGFCRNCLAKWLKTASDQHDGGIEYQEALQIIYGMPYEQWKTQHQPAATAAQIAAFKERAALHADTTVL